ncbi:hypothetical protein LX87_02125 [Larkinella arboricola]|uniref:Uncharacterized protein n=1 Tax=Larkinella arboricola TaxID=643671 RepID=A0A327X5N3_LARAB|nr:hypothetical protein [Larkinella arboricola]RAK00423.1 hypothetical protein LX87_02125 [Larkinella arboricola]
MNVKQKFAGLFCAFLSVTSVLAQNPARVEKIQGVETYIMCEPLQAYETVFEVATGAKAASLLTGGVVNEGVSDKVSQFVRRATKDAKSKNQEFDAVVISGSKTAIAIKYKDNASRDKGLAKVRKIDGLAVYVMNEPVKDYKTVVDASGGVKAKSYFTSGLVNNSIEEDMEQFVRRVKKEAEEAKKPIDAVVYSSGKRAIGVKFNE